MQCESIAPPPPAVGATVDSCPNAARWRRRVTRDGQGLVVEWSCEQVGRVWRLRRTVDFCEVSVGRQQQLQPFAEGDEVQALGWAWRWLEAHGAPARPEGWAS